MISSTRALLAAFFFVAPLPGAVTAQSDVEPKGSSFGSSTLAAARGVSDAFLLSVDP